MAYEITRVFISFADTLNRKPGVNANSVTGFSIQLPNYVENAVFIELISATTDLNGIFIQIEDWGHSSTSKGKQYWRYVDETSNNRSVDIENSVKRHRYAYELLILPCSTQTAPHVRLCLTPQLYLRAGLSLKYIL
jgi:hypothetical protein